VQTVQSKDDLEEKPRR